MLEFRKWGNGDSVYEVIEKSNYNPISKTFSYTTHGMVEKKGKQWIGGGFVGKSRKEVAEKMVIAGRAE